MLEELFNDYRKVIENLASYKSWKYKHICYSEIFSDLFVLFVKCLNNFNDDMDNKFETYFISSSKYIGMYDYEENKKIMNMDESNEPSTNYCSNNCIIFENKINKNPKLKEVYDLTIEGYNVNEISKKITKSKSCVYRKLRDIREILKDVLNHES